MLVALLFLRDLRSEELLEEIKETTHPTEFDLIGPTQLRPATIQFAARAEGEVVWFNACPRMLESRELCDVMLRPFRDNPNVTSVRFVLDHAQREQWHTRVEATLQAYVGRSAVAPPIWADLDSGVSFIIAETDSGNGKAEALVSFWGEPFMAVHRDRRIPGSIIHVRGHSELIGRFREVERACRMQ